MSHTRPFHAAAACACMALMLTFSIHAVAADAAGPYHVETRWKIGGEGGWDYLAMDSAAHLLYVTHATRVEIVDTQSGKVVGSITGLKGTHGVALDPAGKYGYISDGRANAVVVFDRATRATVATIATGTNPDGIVYEPATKTVWAFNGRSNDATVIDTGTQKVVATIKLSGKPEFPAVDGKGTVFVNIETKNSIVRLDAKTKTANAEWPLKGCESPSGLAIDEAKHRLFAVCDGKKMAVVDADSGKVLALPDIGDGPDAAAFDSKHGVAISSNGDGTLTVVNASGNTFPIVQNLPTVKGARTMAFDPATGKIFLATAEYGPAPAPTADNAHPRPSILPGSFTILVLARQ